MTPKQLGELDWVSALEWCRDNSKELTTDHCILLQNQSARWDQCSMCELPLDKRSFGFHVAPPANPLLDSLGMEFWRKVCEQRWISALKTIDEIRERELELYGETYG